MIRRFAVAGMLALALVTAGSAQASDDFAGKADKVCAAANKQALAITAKIPPTADADPPPAYVKKVAKVWGLLPPLLHREIARLDAVGQPSAPAARAAYKRWRTLMVTVGIPAFEKAVRGAQTGSAQKMNAPLVASQKYDAEMRRLAKVIGFKVCSWQG
jgi:hypothetical protein